VSENKLPFNFRVGFGVDIHQLIEGRPLIIGGVEIESPFGALGHSDADVLLHAICDALLGAVGIGDIGTHFPDTDPAYKNADSKNLLKESFRLIKEKGFLVGNIDCTVLLEQPKLSPYISDMTKVVAAILETRKDQISIKATRGEKIGFIGRGEGIKAYCTLLIYKA
jgi:2-C-methyl-D-erythritol 2,4-cyclodiphosphate synthase